MYLIQQHVPSFPHEVVVAERLIPATMGIEKGLRDAVLPEETRSVSDLIGLVCAVLASLALGVLLAYCVCAGFFRLVANGRTQSTKPILAPERVVAAEG